MPEQGKNLHLDVLRSQLKRARGLGSARSGSAAWWAERLTAIALVPLTLWFIATVISLEGTTRAGMIAWLHAPITLVLSLCLIAATFWHMELGLRVVIDDYVHNDAIRLAMLLLQRGLCIVAALRDRGAAFGTLTRTNAVFGTPAGKRAIEAPLQMRRRTWLRSTFP